MSSVLALRAQGVAADVLERVPSSPAILADPPAGSGLKPVQGEYGAPLVGHTLTMLTHGLEFSRRWQERFGPVAWVGGMGAKIVTANGPDAIEEVLTNRDGAFSNEAGWNYIIGPFFKRGVMLMDFEEHRHHRRIMQAAFKHERLVSYLESLNPAIADGLARWQPRDGFRLYRNAKQLTLDLATSVFVGDKSGSEADRINKAFVDCVIGGGTFLRTDVPGGRWHRGLRGRRVLEEYFRALLPAKRAGDAEDLFSVLCRAEDEDGNRFSDEDIVNHMIFVLMAAHDTSTATLSWMSYFLGRYPEWQVRLREECRALGKPAISFEDLDKLPMMDLVFKETLRYWGPVGVLFRMATKDTELQGHYIPAGTMISVGLFASMRMEPWWSEPDRFDPMRFSEERREDLSHKYAWVPFGGNVHKCIGMHFGGMEVKAILHQMLLRYVWTIRPGYDPPVAPATGPIPADGLPINLRLR
jgi:cytochrome P450